MRVDVVQERLAQVIPGHQPRSASVISPSTQTNGCPADQETGRRVFQYAHRQWLIIITLRPVRHRQLRQADPRRDLLVRFRPLGSTTAEVRDAASRSFPSAPAAVPAASPGAPLSPPGARPVTT